MNRIRISRPAAGVLAAAGVLVALAVFLPVRLLSRDAGTAHAAAPPPPAARVPAPKAVDPAALSFPCWACKEAESWPLSFRTDLDLLAPLGTGTANAGTFFGAFALQGGPRAAEGKAAVGRAVDRPGVGKVLPPDDPLLREAEPWCDQARLELYPEVFAIEGYETRIANLSLALTMARSWIARGQDAKDLEPALSDFRRVVRLGRLLRQEDVVLINDLVGLACIRIGAEAIYDRARAAGRTDLALVAAVVASEAAPQRLLTASRVTSVELAPYLRKGAAGSASLELPEGYVESMRTTALTAPDRRFRGEATLSLWVVARAAGETDRARAAETIREVAEGKDAPLATLARWCLDHPADDKAVLAVAEPMPK